MIIDFHVHTAYYRSRTPDYKELLHQGWGDRLDWKIDNHAERPVLTLILAQS